MVTTPTDHLTILAQVYITGIWGPAARPLGTVDQTVEQNTPVVRTRMRQFCLIYFIRLN